ncbi:MAG: hypothetical protein Q9215_006368 [Flavoplaca cf. flavocitrina]
MDEHGHDPRLTDARSENLGGDLPAKSDLLKAKKRYIDVEEPPKDLPADSKQKHSKNLLRQHGSPSSWFKDLPLSRYRTLGPELPSNVEDEFTESDMISKGAPPQQGSKQPEHASLSKSHSPSHAKSTHRLDPLMSITVWGTDGVAHKVKIKQNATVSELKQHVQAETGIQPHHMDLIYGTITLGLYWVSSEEDYLSDYDIRDKSHMDVKYTGPESYFSGLELEPNTTNHEAQHHAEATSTDYDEDLYIVNPQSHFDMLRRLERDVVRRSEYYRSKQEYSQSSAADPADDDGVFLGELKLPASLQKKIRRSSTVAQRLEERDPSSGTFWQLLKSYSIILNVLRSSREMLGKRFCVDAINLLSAHERVDVVEIRRIPLEMITNIAKGLEATIDQYLEMDLKEISLALNIRGLTLTPCLRLFEQVGRHIPASHALSLSDLLAMVRGVASLLDVALISYVRSHGSGFDSSYFGQDLEKLEVNYGHKMGFRCYWAKLACLHSFLDQKRVWIFDFLDKRSYSSRPRGNRSGSNLLLARMEDLADIWGPVYNVPTGTGLIDYYRVSKGVICRSKSKKKSPVPGATLCHYFSSFSFYKLETRRLGIARDDLALSKDDWLLIGAGFRENQHCRYTMSAFTKESASRMTVLGTKESVWRNDNRTLAVGLSKYFGVTISGTQKLIPETTLKQHILDKWTTKPTRSNPAILNQYLGVEISHCTGNARRVSLKELMVSKPLWPILQCQIPLWHETPWGIAFNTAIHSPKREDIVNVWKDYASDRCQMAELVCRVLEILDTTGWNEQQVFNSAVLIDNEEMAVPVPRDLNTWLAALHDTHLTSAYVITTGICIECEVADHTTSICGASQAFTALKTEITGTESPPGINVQYSLRSSVERFRQVDCGTSTVVLLAPVTRAFSALSFRTGMLEFSEALNRARQDPFTQEVYLRASTRSFRGRYEIKDTLLSKFSFALTRNRDATSIEQMSAVSPHDNELERPKHAGGRRAQHDGLQLLSGKRTPIPFDLIGKSTSHCVTGVSSFSTRGTTNGAIASDRQATLQESIEPPHITDAGADESLATRRPDAIKDEPRRELTNSDLQSRNNDIRYTEIHLRTAEKSNIATANNYEPSRMPRRPTQENIGDIQTNMANYTFIDDDESGADDPITLRQANQMPAIVGSPGGI